MIYKITFEMCEPIVFSELPTFDGLLAYCYIKQKNKPHIDGLLNFYDFSEKVKKPILAFVGAFKKMNTETSNGLIDWLQLTTNELFTNSYDKYNVVTPEVIEGKLFKLPSFLSEYKSDIEKFITDLFKDENFFVDVIDTFQDMPIEKSSNGIFYGSWLQYDKSIANVYQSSIKKRWADEIDYHIDFKGKAEKVRNNAGEHKPYDIRFAAKSIGNVWFYFISNDIERVKLLLDNHLLGIGKYVNKGFGAFTSYSIEEIQENPFEQIIRPIPAEKRDLTGNIRTRLMAYKPPYWLAKNKAACIIS